jgi:hypothetical protein
MVRFGTILIFLEVAVSLKISFVRRPPCQVVQRPNLRQHFYVLRWQIAETTQEICSREGMLFNGAALILLVHRGLKKIFYKTLRQKLGLFVDQYFKIN